MEAGHASNGGPIWLHPSRAANEVSERSRTYLRVKNTRARPMLVPAGAVFTGAGREVTVARDAIVSAEFAALLTAQTHAQGSGARDGGVRRFAGVLPPGLAGLAIWGTTRGTFRYAEARKEKSVRGLFEGLEQACHELPTAHGRTAVGAVFLVGARPVAAHVFSSNDLFAQAMSDLLRSLAISARHAQLSLAEPCLLRRARKSDARGLAIAYLRGSLRVESSRRESSGEGFEVLLRDAGARFVGHVVGHAVLDRRGTVVHLGLYSLPAGARSNERDPTGEGGSAPTPREVDRKPRPSPAELRQRERKPQGIEAGGGRGGD